jgi:membrane protease YdiL (CAAX protease family)
LAALITAFFFSLFHFNPYGIIPLAALGLYFGFAAYMSESLIIPILLHFLNNFFAVMLYFTIGEDELLTVNSVQNEALTSHVILFFVLTGFFLLLIIFIKNYYLKTKKNLENNNANMPKM